MLTCLEKFSALLGIGEVSNCWLDSTIIAHPASNTHPCENASSNLTTSPSSNKK